MKEMKIAIITVKINFIAYLPGPQCKIFGQLVCKFK